jgi:tetratricopeptide (TPR) repeat protein
MLCLIQGLCANRERVLFDRGSSSFSVFPRVLVIGAVLCLAACAGNNTKPEPPPPPTTEQLMSQADSAAAAGQREQALTLLDTAAKNDPTNKQPWLRTAQIQFDSGNYGQAIIAGQEALQRDPTDKTANSIITVSGLRVATRALAALRDQSNLTGSVRTEAETLARTMRENLGEDVLIPQPAVPVAAATPRPAAHHHPKQPVPASAPAAGTDSGNAQADAAAAPPPSGGNDPFSSLKN